MIRAAKDRAHMLGILFPLSLFCLFAVCAFLVVMSGAGVYQEAVRSMEDTYSTGTALTYVSEKLRSHDREGDILLTDMGGRTALLLFDEINGEIYESHIYPGEGCLCELTVRDGTEVTPSMGEEILAVKDFTIEGRPGGFLELSARDTDGVTVSRLVHLANSSGYSVR